MNFDPLNQADCVVDESLASGSGGSGGLGGGGGSGGAIDPRCNDSDFAASNPSICGSSSYLVIKPESSLISILDSIAFAVYEYRNGIESQVIDSLVFSSSDLSVFIIGVSSGSGTGLQAGTVVIKVVRNGKSATAEVTVLAAGTGCNDRHVKSLLLVDNSRSASLVFGGAYQTRLDFEKAAANLWCDKITIVDGTPKDSVKVWAFESIITQETPDYLTDTDALNTAITGITQLLGKTDIFLAMNAAVDDLTTATSDEKVIVLFSDGEQTSTTDSQPLLNLAASFKAAGGIIIVIGIRASTGFDLLERIATGGFFINATPATAADALKGLSFLKSAVCAGSCAPDGDKIVNQPQLDYSSFQNWEVIAGQVNLLGNGLIDVLPNNGLYVELCANDNPATMRTIDSFALLAGQDYQISFNLAGNNRINNPSANAKVKVYLRAVGAAITDPNIFEHTAAPNWSDGFQRFSFSFTAAFNSTVKIYFQQIIDPLATGDFLGDLLDGIKFMNASTLTTLFEDSFDDENPQYLQPSCGPSAAISAIDDPPAPSFGFVNYPGGAMQNSQDYEYAISYVTAEGETAISPLFGNPFENFSILPNRAILVSLPVPNEPRVIQKRLWRNKQNGSMTVYLLAVFEVNVPQYYDTETHAEFSARVDTSIVAPTTNTTGRSGGQQGIGYSGCYSDACDAAFAVGPQFQDPNPLPDVETGTTPPPLFTSTQGACASCPQNQVNLSTTNLFPTMTSNTEPEGVASDNVGDSQAYKGLGGDHTLSVPGWLRYQFAAPVTIRYYQFNVVDIFGVDPNIVQYPIPSLDFNLEGSNDGTNWTVMDSRRAIYWDGGTAIKKFSVAVSQQFLYVRLNFLAITRSIAGANTDLSQFKVFGSISQQVCQTAQASSYVSQADADNKAKAAAMQAAQVLLNCVTQYTSTKSYTADCATQVGISSVGNPVTKTATATSLVSQDDADNQAQAQAKAAAVAELVCTGSNNTQPITINDFAAATPYPTAKYVSGLSGVVTKVVATLNGFSHTSPEDVKVLLVAPSGETCLLMAHVGGQNAVNGLTLVFDDSAASFLPQGPGTISSGTWKPTRYLAIQDFESPVPPQSETAYGSILAVFNGINPNGSWGLFVDDDQHLDIGVISGGWDITITTA